jgi:hypothetical protein
VVRASGLLAQEFSYRSTCTMLFEYGGYFKLVESFAHVSQVLAWREKILIL